MAVSAVLEIITFQDHYLSDVAGLITEIQNNEFGIPISLAEQPDLQSIPDFYQTRNGNFWIVKADDVVVGTIALLDIGNHQGALRKMFVKKEYRGKEYLTGQRLLKTLLDWSGQKGFSEIFLGTTDKFLAAHRFYEKNGFVRIEREALPANFPVMKVDTVFYRYSIYG